MAVRRHQNRKFVTAFPPRQYKDKPIGLMWKDIPSPIRMDFSRTVMELHHGLAMKKDHFFDRPKYCQDGFYGLEVAKDELYRLEQIGADNEKLDAAREGVLRAVDKLAGDEARWQAVEQEIPALAVWDRYFQERGKTTTAVLNDYMGLETGLRKDFTNGYFALADYVGFDPVAMLQIFMARPESAGRSA
jgi:hypothetical protein